VSARAGIVSVREQCCAGVLETKICEVRRNINTQIPLYLLILFGLLLISLFIYLEIEKQL